MCDLIWKKDVKSLFSDFYLLNRMNTEGEFKLLEVSTSNCIRIGKNPLKMMK